MIKINETEKILSKLKSTPVEINYEEDYKWATELKRESNYKSLMSEIKSAECWVD
jgi:hypothetical protein